MGVTTHLFLYIQSVKIMIQLLMVSCWIIKYPAEQTLMVNLLHTLLLTFPEVCQTLGLQIWQTLPSFACNHNILACCLWFIHQVCPEQHCPAHTGLPQEVRHPRFPVFHLPYWWAIWECQKAFWRTGVFRSMALFLFFLMHHNYCLVPTGSLPSVCSDSLVSVCIQIVRSSPRWRKQVQDSR